MTSWYASRSLFRIDSAKLNAMFAFSICATAWAVSTLLPAATAMVTSRASFCSASRSATARPSVAPNGSAPRSSCGNRDGRDGRRRACCRCLRCPGDPPCPPTAGARGAWCPWPWRPGTRWHWPRTRASSTACPPSRVSGLTFGKFTNPSGPACGCPGSCRRRAGLRRSRRTRLTFTPPSGALCSRKSGGEAVAVRRLEDHGLAAVRAAGGGDGGLAVGEVLRDDVHARALGGQTRRADAEARGRDPWCLLTRGPRWPASGR